MALLVVDTHLKCSISVVLAGFSQKLAVTRKHRASVGFMLVDC